MLLGTKLMLQKRKAKVGKSMNDNENGDFPVPSTVIVMERHPTHDEDTREDARENSQR